MASQDNGEPDPPRDVAVDVPLDNGKVLHLYPAPTFERVQKKVSVLGIGLPGIRYERRTSGETQCVRTKVMARTSTISLSARFMSNFLSASYSTGVIAGEKPGVAVHERTVAMSVGSPLIPGMIGMPAGDMLGGATLSTEVTTRETPGSVVHEKTVTRTEPSVKVGDDNGLSVGGGSYSTTKTTPVTPKQGRDLESGVQSTEMGKSRKTHVEVGPAGVGLGYEQTKKKAVVLDKGYVVLGIFSGADGIPNERLIRIKRPPLLFWYIFWGIVRLRGINWFLSLKDVKEFAIYECNWKTGVHKRVSITHQQGVYDLRLLMLAYKSWRNSGRIGEGWAEWIYKTINNKSNDPLVEADGNSFSIEVVLDWSAFRISAVILLPVLLSLAVGIWFNSRDWNDLVTIQTAWGIASYVAVAGGLVATLLAFVSRVTDK